MLNAAIADNMNLVTVADFAPSIFGLLNQSRLNKQVQTLGKELKLKAASLLQSVKTLSGGNQQKVVIGKWLAAKPRVFIIDEPTRGVDIGAKYEVYSLVRELAKAGTGILFISSELEELLGVCDRLLVMRNGELVAEFAPEGLQKEQVLTAAFGELAA